MPNHFAEIDNGDSWQAHAGTQCIYVSALKVVDANGVVSAATLFAAASSKLAPPSQAERLSFEEPGLKAEAQITPTATGFDLKGFTCNDGCVATCLISFAEKTDRDWAIATWRSLRPSVSKAKPWWRLW